LIEGGVEPHQKKEKKKKERPKSPTEQEKKIAIVE
jgi:hypothetical protein